MYLKPAISVFYKCKNAQIYLSTILSLPLESNYSNVWNYNIDICFHCFGGILWLRTECSSLHIVAEVKFIFVWIAFNPLLFDTCQL